MKLERNKIFETNSSSTHALVITSNLNNEDYVPKNPTILIDFVNTDDEWSFCTLREKVSYLVSHIIRNYKYNVATYEDLIDQVKEDYDFKRISKYVKDRYDKDIVFPAKYDGDLDDIVEINHQLICNDLDDLLDDIIKDDYHDLLDDVLSPSTIIKMGRD